MAPSFSGHAERIPFLLLTCEHGGREVPSEYQHCFSGADETLSSHRGYDIGALGVAHRMASLLAAPILFSTTTRLLIDLNRSLDQADLFSEFTSGLSDDDRSSILTRYYIPHRECVSQIVAAVIDSERQVIHVGVHSCADRLNHCDRDLDIALLYDEARAHESALCEAWQRSLREIDPRLRYRFNQPYRGSDDGLTTTLRQQFDANTYLGIEIEVRQGMIIQRGEQDAVGSLLADSLRMVLTTLRM